MKLIDKDAVVAEIERRKHKLLDNIMFEHDKEWVVRTARQLNRIIMFLDTLEVKEVDMGKSIDVDSMVTEYLKQYEEAGQTPFAMNIIGSAYMKGLEDMFRLKAQKGEEV